jgi:2'-5' RNA ligase
VRTFIALPASDELRTALVQVQRRLREADADVRWEGPDKLHVTLKFLGDVPEDRIVPLGEAVAAAVQNIRPFTLVYRGAGCFPESGPPRIVWAGTEPNEDLQALFRVVEEACSALGFPRETRRFHPHITLGRVKGTRNLARLTEATNSVKFEPISTLCRELLLMKSVLRPEGSAYSILKTISLLS